ncbi:MAG: hypothetical protein N2560_06470 [Ignavibacteria bacterium]|nr:hypothetical protein [Ignavibacteria bacterium]
MRTFEITKGKYKGKYTIYESVKEFLENHHTKKYHKWTEDNPYEFQIGEYVEVNDGVLLPILNIYPVKRKDGVEKGLLIRFPNGTASVYKSVNGEISKSKFLGNYSNIDPYSLSNKTRNTRVITNSPNKQLFISLVSEGTPLVKALLIAYPNVAKFSSKKNIRHKLTTLLNDQEVITMLKETNNPFIEKLCNDPEFSDEAMIEYIKSFKNSVRKGSQTHLNSIPLLLKLTNKLPETFENKRKIEDIKYEEIPPEQLPPITENN